MKSVTNSKTINLLKHDRHPYRPRIYRIVSFFLHFRPSLDFGTCFRFFGPRLDHPTNYEWSLELIGNWKNRKLVEIRSFSCYWYSLLVGSILIHINIIFRLVELRKDFFFKVVKKHITISLKKTLAPTIGFLMIVHCGETKEAKSPFMQILDGISNQFIYGLVEPGDKSGSDAAIDQFILVLNLAQNRAHCVFQDIDNPLILEKLKELHTRGIDVKVGMDEDNRSYIGYKKLNTFLPSIGKERKLWIGNKGEGQVYMNFCVVDERRVVFSTTSLTKLGLNSSPFMYGMVQSNEDGIVRKFSGATDLILNGSFGSSKQRLNQRNHWLVGDTDIGIYLAPEESPVNFIAKRIPNATNSIQLFTTEFFSNRRISSTNTRTLEDIAYEIKLSNVPSKTVIGSWKNDTEPDPNAEGSCSFNEYLDISCNPNLNAGTSGDAPRRINSLHYLRTSGIEPRIYANSKSTNSLNIAILDTGSPNGITFVSSSPFSSRGDSSHDGYIFVFEDRINQARIQGFYDSLLRKSKISNSSLGFEDSKFMDVVISEINWMGGGNSVGNDSRSEWIEFFNNTDNPINVSDWSFQCGSNGSFISIFKFPPRTLIGSKQYFLVQHKQDSMLREVHLTLDFGGTNIINDTRTDQCRIIDGKGRVIDTAGNLGVPFIARNQTFGKIDVDRGQYRTMERMNLTTPGENISNWKTNSNTNPDNNYNFHPDYYEKTFGTPGYEFNPGGDIPPDLENPTRSLVINEIGFTGTTNTYLEIFNPTDSPITLNSTKSKVSLFRSNNCNISSGSYTQKIDLTGTIPAKGYYVLSRPGAYDSISNDLSLGTLGTSYCVGLILAEGVTGLNHPGLIDFVNLGSNSISLLGSSSTEGSNIQRCPNGHKTTVYNNSTDFQSVSSQTLGEANVCN